MLQLWVMQYCLWKKCMGLLLLEPGSPKITQYFASNLADLLQYLFFSLLHKWPKKLKQKSMNTALISFSLFFFMNSSHHIFLPSLPTAFTVTLFLSVSLRQLLQPNIRGRQTRPSRRIWGLPKDALSDGEHSRDSALSWNHSISLFHAANRNR